MVDFYEFNIIPDILKHFKVKNIIIIDLHDKKLIREIIKYDAQITAIANENPNNFDLEIIKGNSLNILPKFNNYDAIFINDDPNWYTIINQLNIIKETNNEFPLVFICNNKFPHKRRDSYSNPDNIPKEFRQEFTRDLPLIFNDKKIFIQDNYFHATIENTDRNGVSTAIEDFLKSNREISIMNLHFIEEITILYPQSTISKIRIDKIMQDIKNKNISSADLYSAKLENQVLLSYISKNNKLINTFENTVKVQDDEIEYKNSKIEGVESKINLKVSQIKNLESKLINKDVKIKNLNNQITTLENNLNEAELQVQADENTQNKIHDQIDVIQGVFNSFENQIDELIEDKTKLSNELNDANKSINALKNQNNILNRKVDGVFNSFENQIDELIEDKTKLSNELNDANKSINALKNQNNILNREVDNNTYCISCFKEEISNNTYEINYMKKNNTLKGILSPLSYLILLLKSKPHELHLNIKLYKTLKNSECFDKGFYLKNNTDLLNSFWSKYFSPELHYVCNGFIENRTFNKKYFNRNSKKELLEYLSKCDEQ